MIVIAGHIRIDPANRNAARAAVRTMTSASCAETGRLSYTFSADLEDEAVLHVFEEWHSQDDLATHQRSPHMAAFQQAVAAVGMRGRQIRRLEVVSEGPLG